MKKAGSVYSADLSGRMGRSTFPRNPSISHSWLMQKLNGNKVNGKQASFTDGERQQFREALQDLLKKLSAAAMIF